MLRYITKRVLLAILSVWAVCTFTFFVAFLAPGDPVELAAGQHSDPAYLQQVRHEYGLDLPPLVRYLRYMGGVLHGDLGKSYVSHEPVSAFLMRALPNTVELACAAIVLAVVFGISAGLLAASRPNSVWDRTIMGVVLLGVTLPPFVLAPVLVLLLALKLQILPVAGWGSLTYVVLPAIVLAARPAALIARMTRSSTLDVQRQDYVRTAKAKGLSPQRILFRHVLKNAFLPVLTSVGTSFGYLLSGSFVVETAFAIPGVGYQSIQSIATRDYTVIQGTTLVLAVAFVTVNLVVDILYTFLDPRIKVAAGGAA